MTDSIQHQDTDYTLCSLIELATLYRAKTVTPSQVLAQYMARIKCSNGPFYQYTDDAIGYNAMSQLFGNEPYVQAFMADERFARYDPEHDEPPPLLCGVPLAIKEIIEVKAWQTLNGAPDMFAGNHAARDATIVEKLHAQGAVLIGHTIASRLSGDAEGSFAGNAWDPARSPGGSSQGSGVAPMVRFCVAALGAETGGSIIHPGAANGASAIKPSSGLISVAGTIPLRAGVDVIGPIARSMQDAAILMNAIIGVDPRDPQTLLAPTPPLVMPTMPRPDEQPLSGITIGVPQKDWMRVGGTVVYNPPYQAYQDDYKEAFDRFKRELVFLGATVVDFDGLDFFDPQDDPYYHGPLLGAVDTEVGGVPSPMYVSAELAVNLPILIESLWLDELEAFIITCPREQRNKLIYQYLYFNARMAAAGIVAQGYRLDGLRMLALLRNNYAAAMAAQNIDFMLVLPLGDHPRFKRLPSAFDLPVQRAIKEMPNMMGWPMVTFPIGHALTGGEGIDPPVEMPINAAFWGPRFSDGLLAQAVIDYQERFDYHKKLPKVKSLPAPSAAYTWV